MAETAKKGAAKKARPKAKAGVPISHGVGRRKRAVARVWLRPGAGAVRVNGRAAQEYFDTAATRATVDRPFRTCPIGTQYDVQARVCGGGKQGQAHAVKLAIARALLENDETLRPALRQSSLLTVDSRVKERKKYGRRGARRSFQFVKR